MMRRFLIAPVLATALISCAAFAQNSATSPAGLWKTIDDETGKPKSLLRISDSNGEYQGRIEKLFRDPGLDPNPKCEKCEDARKDQPIVGMTVLTGLKQTEANEYTGGTILDPATGKIYKTKVSLDEDGKKLNMRAYIGVPMLGRTQVWLREQ